MNSPDDLPKLKVIESTVFEIMEEGLAQIPPPPPFVEGVGTKYLRTGRVKVIRKCEKKRVPYQVLERSIYHWF